MTMLLMALLRIGEIDGPVMHPRLWHFGKEESLLLEIQVKSQTLKKIVDNLPFP